MISVIDLTELKTSEEELRESECRYRAVVEQATEGIYEALDL
jgi:PAS domain-containing protein